MITKMTKYSIVAFTPEIEGFLSGLQELGMVDVARSVKNASAATASLLDQTRRLKGLIAKLKGFAAEGASPAELGDPASILKECEGLIARIGELEGKNKSLLQEASAASLWGEFSNSDIDRLKAIGHAPHFFSVGHKNFDPSWEERYPLCKLAEDDRNILFTVLESEGEPFDFPLQEEKFPERPAKEFLAEVASNESEIKACRERLASFAAAVPQMEAIMNSINEQADRAVAEDSSRREAEEKLTVLIGFAPEENRERVAEYLDKSDVVYFTDAATVEDNPPIKLKNNWFSRTFEAIGDLYVLPQYDELDLTPYFAPFYMLFFGLCLGDMGYGLLLLIAGLLVNWKVTSLKKYSRLVIFLGIGTILMSALNGTCFGMNIYETLGIDFGIDRFPFENIQMFWFAIIFGIVHIIVARLVSAIYLFRKKGWQAGLSNVGWALLLTWCTLAYAGSQIGQKLIVPWMTYVMLYGGLLLVVGFSSLSRNIFKRLGSGVYALYDITGFFGDILSYIRLFGLGCSGGILGMVMNSMALQTANIPYVGWLFCTLILLAGHGLVLGLSALGAFVHPLRLTFVEFYKNAGFNGGGKAYEPMKKNNNK